MKSVIRIQRLSFPLGRWNLIVVGGSEFNLRKSQLLATLECYQAWESQPAVGRFPAVVLVGCSLLISSGSVSVLVL